MAAPPTRWRIDVFADSGVQQTRSPLRPSEVSPRCARQRVALQHTRPLGSPASDTFASPRAAHHYKVLHERRVVTDYRGDRLRIGFGIYHSEHDVERLVRVIEDLGLE